MTMRQELRLAVLNVDLSSGTRFVRFWVDETPICPTAGNPVEERRPNAPTLPWDVSRTPNNERVTPPRMNQSRTPPEDQNPRGCSLHSMEPLRDWFCKAPM